MTLFRSDNIYCEFRFFIFKHYTLDYSLNTFESEIIRKDVSEDEIPKYCLNFEEWKEYSPFLINVTREGIILWKNR